MVNSIGWQTMTDITNSTKEQFSLHHTELQSMLVESVSDCKSSNHIVILSVTSSYWWWKSSEKGESCEVPVTAPLTAYMACTIHDTGPGAGKCISHLTWVLATSRAAHTQGCHSSSPSCQRVICSVIGQWMTRAGLWLVDAGHIWALDPGSGW